MFKVRYCVLVNGFLSGLFQIMKVVFISCLFNSCSPGGQSKSKEQSSVDTLVRVFDRKAMAVLDSITLDSMFADSFVLKAYESRVRSFYANRNWSFAWYGNSGLREHAGFLLRFLEMVKLEGVKDTFPLMDLLEVRMNIQAGKDSLSPPDPVLDMLLTSSFFWYTDAVWNGLPEEKSKALGWFLPRYHVNKGEWLDSALRHSPDGHLLSKAVFRQYYWLRNYLVKYDSLEKCGGWPVVNLNRKSLRIGDTDSIIPLLSQSLYLQGDLARPDSSMVFDTVLAAGIRRFQSRHGLTPDGVAGPAFFRQLNVPVSVRIEQILLNMERSRWMPSDYPPDYLIVNIPDFSLYAYEDAKQIWTMPVVVGKEVHETATFKGVLKHVVFNPYWVIPPGILYNEIIPGVLNNPSYLKKHNMEVVDRNSKSISASKINWSNYTSSGFPYTIRQRPGSSNSLGKVKFLFPNSFSIYLHDTPSRSLFKEEKRAFSHGCIRVSDPEKLAIYILEKEGWSPEKVRKSLRPGKEVWVPLSSKIPVFIVYFTAWVENDGQLHFREDVYKRDQKLKEELIGVSADSLVSATSPL